MSNGGAMSDGGAVTLPGIDAQKFLMRPHPNTRFSPRSHGTSVRQAMGCLCSRTAEVWEGEIPIAPGVTCEQAREFLQQPMNWAAIQDKPESTVTKHDDGSWDLCFPGGDVFTVYDEAVTGTAEAGDLTLYYRGNLKISPGSMDFAQKYAETMCSACFPIGCPSCSTVSHSLSIVVPSLWVNKPWPCSAPCSHSPR